MDRVVKKDGVLRGESLHLGYHTAGKTISVAENINFVLQRGKLTCLLGPNGVGKSTLIKTIMGQIPALGGNLYLLGRPIKSYTAKQLATQISVVLTDKISSGNLTVQQLVELGRIPHTGWLGRLSKPDQEKVEVAIQSTKVGYLKNKKLSELSDGQLQKTMIARALAQNGDLLILDEPTAHLDLINRFEIMHLLRNIALHSNKAVLVVTHDLDIAIETADEFWLMQCGFPLTIGTPEDLILNDQINILLPSSQLTFDKFAGKIQPLAVHSYPTIQGPEEWVKWVKLALLKRGINASTNCTIRKKENQISISNEHNSSIEIVNDIAELIEFLVQK